MRSGKYNKRSEVVKKKIIDTCENEGNWRSICETFSIKIRKAYNWILKRNDEPGMHGGARNIKKTPEMIKTLARLIADTQITLGECLEKLLTSFGVSFCLSTIKNWLNG